MIKRQRDFQKARALTFHPAQNKVPHSSVLRRGAGLPSRPVLGARKRSAALSGVNVAAQRLGCR